MGRKNNNEKRLIDWNFIIIWYIKIIIFNKKIIMANNNSDIIFWKITEILNITPKWFAIFLLDLDESLISNYPNSIFPIRWDKYIKVLGFIWKDFELLEWFDIKIQWKFEPRNESYVYWDWTTSPKLEFKIEWGTEIELIWWITSLSWLKAYLVRYIPWIGEAQANEIFKTYEPKDLITMLDWKQEEVIKKLLDIKWIWETKALMIKEAWDQWKVERNVLIDLWELWLSINKCWAVYKTWGHRYKEILDKDPYQLTEIPWIWFSLADEVAMKYLNIEKKDARRYAWIVEYIIRKYATDNWDTIISIESIKEGIKDFISKDDVFENKDIDIIAEKGIEKSLEKNNLYKINDKVYSLWYYAYIETRIARKIEEWKNSKKEKNIKLDKYLNDLKKSNMTEEQLNAVYNAYNYNISIILWWAWTWKTFTVWKLIEWLRIANEDYYIVTPTNKAKSRVLEVNPKANAATIHSLLEIKPWEQPVYNEENPLPYKYLIIDETSMLDNQIAKYLLDAINFKNTTIVFVWDPRQLPPVWAGSFFADIIRSEVIEDYTTRLTEVKRANNEKYEQIKKKWFNFIELTPWIHNIVANAKLILDGKMPIDTKLDSINLLPESTNSDIINNSVYENIKDIISVLEKNNIDINKDFQIYAPTYKWNVWIPKINKFISDMINPNPIIKTNRGPEFKLNEKVMYSETDKQLGLTKWDIWVITDIDPENNKITINFYLQGIIIIEWKNLDNLEYGYCISVHKAQWTEIKYWAIILTWSAWLLLSNQLLYTAYTRCKEKVWLLWDQRAYKQALKTHIHIRNTLLYHFLAKTPLQEIYPWVSRKQWWISINEIKQITSELNKKYNIEQDKTKIIKINYENTKNSYSYYRYIYSTKENLSSNELIDGIKLTDEEVQNLIENKNIIFLRIKKYNSEKEKRWMSNKVIKDDNTLFIEINSYNKDVSIS